MKEEGKEEEEEEEKEEHGVRMFALQFDACRRVSIAISPALERLGVWCFALYVDAFLLRCDFLGRGERCCYVTWYCMVVIVFQR